jgi:putative glutamine amidotransferase
MARLTATPAGRPLIGVTTSEVRAAQSINQTSRSEPARPEMALGMSYLRALEAAGALPVVLPPVEEQAIESMLDRLDGLCLSGGPDLDPATYGAAPHPELGPTWPDLDRIELTVAHAADAREMPILAICRGAQALNVARGGTLRQHLPDHPGALDHRQREPGEVPTHPVEVLPGSRLAEALAATELEVNSFHHQGIGKLGRGLRGVATAPDGSIEGIEDESRTFLIGVQWHAEGLAGRSFEASLFARFVDAASGLEWQRSSLSGARSPQ